MSMAFSLDGLVQEAIAELREWRDEHPDEEPHDAIFEIADSYVPVYTDDSHPEV